MTEEETNKALARVILSTKRKKRQYSLFDIANDVQFLKKEKGSLKKVADLIGISPGMLSQFLSVYKLPDPIIELVKQRKIDSVSMVHHLAKYNFEDKQKLAEELSNNRLSSQDLRVLIPFRKQYPNEPIENLLEKIYSSKNIKVSVIKIGKEDLNKSLDKLTEQLENYIGSENIISVDFNDNLLDIKIKKEGEKELRKIAKDQNKTLKEFIDILIN